MSRQDFYPGGTESILQRKRNWLRSRIDEIGASYSDTVDALIEKLNAITTEPLDVARNLLNRPDNALTLYEIASAANMLEECNNHLFDILLAVCSLGERRPTQRLNTMMHLVPVANNPIIRQENGHSQIISVSPAQHVNMDNARVILESSPSVAGQGQLRYNSEDEDGALLQLPENSYDVSDAMEPSAPPLNNVQIPTAETDLDLTLSTIAAGDASAFSSPTRDETSVADVGNNRAAVDGSPESNASSSNKVYCSFSSDESDPNSFHGCVCDVSNPYHFSVQPSENIHRIEEMQKELNAFYQDRNNSSLESLSFLTVPQLGEYCAAVFKSDCNWYRAVVTRLTSQSTIVVDFIDYGNECEVEWRSAYKLHPLFSELAAQAIRCRMADISPLTAKPENSGGSDGEWSKEVSEWFDDFTYGSYYKVVPMEFTSSAIAVKLLYMEETKDNDTVVKSVADTMIEAGMAMDVSQTNSDRPFQNAPAEIQRNSADANSGSVHRGSDAQQESQDNIDARSKDSSRTDLQSVGENHLLFFGDGAQKATFIPAGSERTYSRESIPVAELSSESHDFKVAVEATKPNGSNFETTGEKDIAYSSGNSSAGASKGDQKTVTDKDEEILVKWNPMAEDFKSIRNSYGVDNENACVVTEGYNPENLIVCHHYVKGDCWKGNKCINAHPPRLDKGNMKYEVPTFAGFQLECLRLEESSWSIVRLMQITSHTNFYAHIVKTLDSMHQCMQRLMCCNRDELPEMSPDLYDLKQDMSKHYASGTRKLRDLVKPTPGDIFAVHVQEHKCFYRGLILAVKSTMPYVTVKVHLVDIGRDAVVPEMCLHSMLPAFMHLPKQAVQCSLWDGKPSVQVKLEQYASSRKGHSLLAMKVNSRADATGGPLTVTLYAADSNGLHPLTS